MAWRAQEAQGNLPRIEPPFGDDADQCGEARFVGQGLQHRCGDFGKQHIQITGVAEHRHQFVQWGQQRVGKAGGQQGAE